MATTTTLSTTAKNYHLHCHLHHRCTNANTITYTTMATEIIDCDGARGKTRNSINKFDNGSALRSLLKTTPSTSTVPKSQHSQIEDGEREEGDMILGFAIVAQKRRTAIGGGARERKKRVE
ncbi:Hypothetical predicted protein [Olea europaea subsp. europaea]|uniref:Uncharacterized protein n=1 Tax=Olea europaea subsp. europaea TaxID=158383 RepID=A0A8S0Q5D2_OLEEU|nr:Hypothetical predicted protein [Olea europaea subsp. europaea]